MATTVKVNGLNGVKLYSRAELLKSGPLGPDTMVITPEGIQAYDTKVVNVSYIPPNENDPSFKSMTGYGASYMTKVMSGTNRAVELLINVYANTDSPSSPMLQIFATAWNAQLDKPTNYYDAKLLVGSVVGSLPDSIKSQFIDTRLVIEAGNSPTPVGWA